MIIEVANSSHCVYARIICDTIAESAKQRGTGIAKRTPKYIISKMYKGDAVIALDGSNFVGFSYIESWSHQKFIANSGLIVHANYRGKGIAKRIKRKIFEHSRAKYPKAKLFSITTGPAVMKMNTELGYMPVPFSELTTDQSFWKGCQSCKNYDVLNRTNQKMCLCTGLLFDPNRKKGFKSKGHWTLLAERFHLKTK